MKKSLIYIHLVALAAISLSVTSCKKDDIEVKNGDYTWQVDKDITDNDIRTRLGYDPRLDYILFDKTEIDMPMLSLGSVADNRTHTEVLKVQLLDKPYSKDVQVTFAFDASLYDRVRSTHSGFELGNTSLLKIDGTNQTSVVKTIPAGQTAVSFTLTTTNDIHFNQRVIFPFSFKINETGIVIPEGKNIAVVKVFPETIKVSVENKSVNKIVGLFAGTSYIGNNSKQVTFNLKSNHELPAGVKLKLVYDNDSSLPSSTEKATSATIDGTLPEVDFNTVDKSYSFRVAPNFTTAKKYALPLKWQLTDASGTELPVSDNKLFVNFDVKELIASDNNLQTLIGGQAVGNVINRGENIAYKWIEGGTPQYQDWQLDTSVNSMIDGLDTTTGYVDSTTAAFFNFREIKLIKTIKISVSKNYPIKSLDIYADIVADTYAGEKQGTVTFTEGKLNYTVVLKEAMPASTIVLKSFVKQPGGDSNFLMGITEIDFYEQ